jgi:ABC-type Mn2+/Zn2+ transport system permease subunit
LRDVSEDRLPPQKAKKDKIFMIIRDKRLFGIMLAVALLLLIPLIAMKFTNEVKWTMFDFVVAGVLLFGTGLICELAMRKVTKIGQRIAVCAGILLMLLLIWAELAVGLIGTPLAGN